MIKSIHSNSPFITVSGGNPGSTYIGNYSNNAPGVGNMRYNPNSQNIEVYDGSTWIILSAHHANINLTPEAVSLLEWARKKRDEEMMWQSLAKENKAVKIALDNLEQARQQLDITAKLSRDYETTN